MTSVEELQAEVEALKKKVRDQRTTVVTVAQKYAKQHNLCGVVDEALKEAGFLGPTKTIYVEIEVPMTVQLGVDGEIFDEMTEDEQKEFLADIGKISGVTWVNGAGAVTGVANGTVRRASPVTTIGDIVVKGLLDSPPPLQTGAWPPVAPPGYISLYTQPEGRKIHFVRIVDEGYEGGRQTQVVQLAGGAQVRVSRGSVCSVDLSPYYGTWWQETSPRAIGAGTLNGICRTCRERAERDFGWGFAAPEQARMARAAR